jgi:ubiquinone/menaquinone biosynthesis C-methylase UbiE
MSITEEYKNQLSWRSWETYLKKLPVKKEDHILDMGCSIGAVSELLSFCAGHVTGIDYNPDLLEEARQNHSQSNIDYILCDLREIENLEISIADGIWSSFVVSYFPDLEPVMNAWLKLLKPGGWLALVEMSDLFGHSPLSHSSVNTFRDYYVRQRKANIYDFEMGGRLKKILINLGLTVIQEENMYDPELTFSGPATSNIMKGWSDRFERMVHFRQYLGEELFQELKEDFLNCLMSDHHSSNTIVKYIIAEKQKKA